MTQLDAVYAFVTAFAVTVLLTRPVARFARRVGAVDQPKARGLGARGDAAARRPGDRRRRARRRRCCSSSPRRARTTGCSASSPAASLITLVGALDDRFDLAPGRSSCSARSPRRSSRSPPASRSTNITLPFLGAIDFGYAGRPGHRRRPRGDDERRQLLRRRRRPGRRRVRDLRGGVQRSSPSTSTTDYAGDPRRAAPRARRPGSWCSTSRRRRSTWATAGPTCSGCCWAASPSRARSRPRPCSRWSSRSSCWPCRSWTRRSWCLKRMKYRRKVYIADANHFHHRFSRIGFSQRRTVALPVRAGR